MYTKEQVLESIKEAYKCGYKKGRFDELYGNPSDTTHRYPGIFLSNVESEDYLKEYPCEFKDKEPQITKWEYLTLNTIHEFDRKLTETQNLNQYGKDGWELIDTVKDEDGVFLTFKRPLNK